MKHILEAVEGITLRCKDQLHQLLQLAGSDDGVGDIYDQLEVCVVCMCVCVCACVRACVYVCVHAFLSYMCAWVDMYVYVCACVVQYENFWHIWLNLSLSYRIFAT